MVTFILHSYIKTLLNEATLTVFMPIIELDELQIPQIIGLADEEQKRWRKQFGEIRKQEQSSPSQYVDMAVKQLGGDLKLSQQKDETTKLIFDIREAAYKIYTKDEHIVYGKAMKILLQDNPDAKLILQALVENDRIEGIDSIINVFGELTGRIFPYSYELAKSITQSRRSRAGQSFEYIMKKIIDFYQYPCAYQSEVGAAIFMEKGFGKMVDAIIPGIEQYNKDRSHTVILTMKTSLRERWQEVVEELHRTNIPHIYLLTLDDQLNDNKLKIMEKHNITLVVPQYTKNNQDRSNIRTFEELFQKDIPHILKWWDEH